MILGGLTHSGLTHSGLIFSSLPVESAAVWWRWSATLLSILAGLAAGLGFPAPALAQGQYEVSPLGTDESRKVDRYQVTLGTGASLWDLGFNRMPLVAIEQGDQKVVEIIEQSFRAAYPDRGPQLVKPGDTFVLEVPSGTFVAKTVNKQPDRVNFESYAGDQLTTFPQDPIVQYRLRRAATPDQIEVMIQGGQTNAVDEAKKIYDVPDPDYLQVRTVRGALMERTARLTIDVNKKYLDEFRLVRDRATGFEETPDGLRAYVFNREDADIPFVRVDDSVGNETEPANFKRVFRIAYYRDGTVRKYIITEPGDSPGALGRAESENWRRTLPQWTDWLPGQPEALPPFAPAISSAGALLPGRILVMAFRPRLAQPSPRPTGASTAGGGSGVTCAGIPLGMVLVGGLLAHRRRSWP